MTFVTDTYDEWTEDAYEYARDQLRADATLGTAGSKGVKSIDIGRPDIELIATHPDMMPCVWLEPVPNALSRAGEVIQHAIVVNVHVFTLGRRSNPIEFAADQAAHRELAGKFYNTVFALHTGGQDAGHWHDWEPHGPPTFEAGIVNGGAGYHTTIPFRLTHDRFWNTGV